MIHSSSALATMKMRAGGYSHYCNRPVRPKKFKKMKPSEWDPRDPPVCEVRHCCRPVIFEVDSPWCLTLFGQRVMLLCPLHETEVVNTRWLRSRAALLGRHSLADLLNHAVLGMMVAEFLLGDGRDLLHCGCRDCALLASALVCPPRAVLNHWVCKGALCFPCSFHQLRYCECCVCRDCRMPKEQPQESFQWWKPRPKNCRRGACNNCQLTVAEEEVAELKAKGIELWDEPPAFSARSLGREDAAQRCPFLRGTSPQLAVEADMLDGEESSSSSAE